MKKNIYLGDWDCSSGHDLVVLEVVLAVDSRRSHSCMVAGLDDHRKAVRVGTSTLREGIRSPFAL